jgi:hypothetical protein
MRKDRQLQIIDRICRINRRSIYDGMTPAMERAIARFWIAFHLACVAA